MNGRERFVVLRYFEGVEKWVSGGLGRWVAGPTDSFLAATGKKKKLIFKSIDFQKGVTSFHPDLAQVAKLSQSFPC